MAKWLDAGGQHQRVLGKAWSGRGRPQQGYLTKRQAQEDLDAILAHARRGQIVAPVRPTRGVRFSEAAAEWLRYIEYDRQRRPSTVRDYKIVVESTLNPAFGDIPIEALTSTHIDSFRVGLVAEGRLSAGTINKYLALVHGILKRAQRVHGLASNVAAGVERQPQQRSGDFNVLAAAEIEALVRAARTPTHFADRVLALDRAGGRLADEPWSLRPACARVRPLREPSRRRIPSLRRTRRPPSRHGQVQARCMLRANTPH